MADLLRRAAPLVAYQACWWTCVAGAGSGWAVVGVVATAAWAVVHVARAEAAVRRRELAVVVVGTALGVVVDSALVGVGAVVFPAEVALGPLPTPLWMVALWTGFATTLTMGVLLPVMRSVAKAGAFGALCGPVAYLGGSRLGPIVLPAPVELHVVAVAVVWAAAMALLALVVRRFDEAGP